MCSVFSFFVFDFFSLVDHLLICVGLWLSNCRIFFIFGGPSLHQLFCKCEAGVSCQVFVGIFNVETAALSNNVKVFTCLQYLLLVFFQKDRHHFFAIGESFLPVLVVQIDLYVLFFAVLIFFNDEFLERVLKDSTEYPFLKDLEVGLGSFLQQEGEQVSNWGVGWVDH